MPIAVDRIRKLPKKLRKSLKRVRKETSIEEVHQFRSRSRRLEATLQAFALDSGKKGRRLLKSIKPVRGKAGKVRDMDVLTRFAAQPQIQGEEECSVQLLEHLGSSREAHAGKLQKSAAKLAPEITKGLKRLERWIEKELEDEGTSENPSKWAQQASVLAMQVEGELKNWPTLNRKNLHPFRLKVKELRYVLEMAQQNDNAFIRALGELKDTVGEWHDWEELEGIASEVLQHPGCKLLKEIRSIARDRFEEALAMANRLRKKKLGGNDRKATRKSQTRTTPAIESALALAS